MNCAKLLTTHTLVHALDYGHFTITGSDSDYDELTLLDDAQSKPPSASDGGAILVLSPHQNNFAMQVTVELWSDHPPSDSDGWEQVSVEPLRVDTSATIALTSPTLESTTCRIPEGNYWVEVSGRGFVNYGWPGSTTPGDQWRLRLWPHTDTNIDSRKLWIMPEHGTP